MLWGYGGLVRVFVGVGVVMWYVFVGGWLGLGGGVLSENGWLGVWLWGFWGGVGGGVVVCVCLGVGFFFVFVFGWGWGCLLGGCGGWVGCGCCWVGFFLSCGEGVGWVWVGVCLGVVVGVCVFVGCRGWGGVVLWVGWGCGVFGDLCLWVVVLGMWWVWGLFVLVKGGWGRWWCVLWGGCGVCKKKLNLVMVTVPETAGTCEEQLKMGELICRGRYTSVYRGALSERSVAVKVYPAAHKHKYDNERYNYSLLLPRQQLNIARFLCGDERVDAGGGAHFLLVLEHYPQGSLSHFLSRWSVDWPSCCRMMHGVSRGLSFLHSEVLTGDEWKPAMVHRDVSSSNVLLRSDLSCVLADFSLSKRLTREPCPQHGGPKTQHGEPRTQHGDSVSEVGALRYLAPELVAGPLCECGAALKQADVYALGLLFWECSRRCHDLFPGGTSPPFQLAFEAELGREPTLQDMHRLVVRDRCRPRPPLQWRDSSSVLQQLKETMEECWDQDAEARLSAQCVEERLDQMSRLHVPATFTHSDGAGGRWPAEPSSCSVDVSEELLSQVRTDVVLCPNVAWNVHVSVMV
uniref:receptor protein serine/threonine kinase n=1 Tax=Knipowitschia caucasica TaxID=637954 RepID=A0AAV2K0X2_KNICA